MTIDTDYRNSNNSDRSDETKHDVRNHQQACRQTANVDAKRHHSSEK